MWALKTLHGLVTLNDPTLRLTGTLVHSCLAYHYASKMPIPPAWTKERTLQEALEHDAQYASNKDELVRSTLAIYNAFQHFASGDAWHPVAVEEEFRATIGDLDPGGPDSSLDHEVVTCRTDLVVEINGELWIVDHKSSGGGYASGNGDRLPKWKHDGEYKLNWQVLMNLQILRASHNVSRLGRRVKGFIVQRIKQRPPYDFDRHVVQIAQLAYDDAPRTARGFVAAERQILERVQRGEKPLPNYSMCWGRYGACDYHDICGASSKAAQADIIARNFRTT